MLLTPPASPLVGPAAAPVRFCIASSSDTEGDDCGGWITDGSSKAAKAPAISEEAALALARARTARKARLAAVGAAEARVRERDAESKAVVEVTRHVEEQGTERVRIEESHRTLRVETVAKVAEVFVIERSRVQRERDSRNAQAVKLALEIWGQVETQRLQAKHSFLHFMQLLMASFAGALLSRRPGRLIRRQWILAVLFLVSAGKMWSDSKFRLLMEQSGPLGGAMRQLIRSAVATVAAVSAAAGAGAEARQAAAGLGGVGLPPPAVVEGLGPCAAPELWRCKAGPNGRVFWHHLSLGPAPWDEGEPATESCELRPADGDARAPRTPRSGKPWTGRLGALLTNWGLGDYAGVLERHGYEAETLRFLSDSETAEMLSIIHCRPEHEKIFRKALDSWQPERDRQRT